MDILDWLIANVDRLGQARDRTRAQLVVDEIKRLRELVTAQANVIEALEAEIELLQAPAGS